VTKVLSMETRPYYAQVALFDPTVTDSYPDWGMGHEEAVASRNGIAVETRPDHLGPVAIEVWTGTFDGTRLQRLVLEGDMTVLGNRGVVVGSVTGNDLRHVAIPAGVHRVFVYANRERGDVDGVYFVVDPVGDQDT
jgi:hypothetical protein